MVSRLEITTETPSKNNQYLKQELDYRTPILDIDTRISEIRGFQNCSGNIGIIGFSSGATLAYLSAAPLNIAVVVGCYGSEIFRYLNEGKNITYPLLLPMSRHYNKIEEQNLNRIQAALLSKENI